MLPTLNVGPWHIHTYHVMATLALLVAGMYSFHRLLQLDHPPEIIVRGLVLTILSGAAGTFLAFAFPYLRKMLLPNSPAPTEGLSATWMLAGGLSTAIIYCRWHRIPLGRALDLGLLPVPLGLAMGRLGCAAAGCCYGKLTDSWLGTYLPDHDGVWAVRYPTQLMSAAANLLIFLTVLTVERCGQRRRGRHKGHSWPFDGFLALLFVSLYCLKRLLIGFLRASAVPVLGPLGAMHIYALVGLVVSTSLIVWNLDKRARSTKEGTQQAASDSVMPPPCLQEHTGVSILSDQEKDERSAR